MDKRWLGVGNIRLCAHTRPAVFFYTNPATGEVAHGVDVGPPGKDWHLYQATPLCRYGQLAYMDDDTAVKMWAEHYG